MWKLLKYGPRLFVVKLINIYQKSLSFHHGPMKHLYPNGFCRFYPSCSEYGKEAILKYGLVLGGLKSIWRIMRCNPWNKGGYDPLK